PPAIAAPLASAPSASLNGATALGSAATATETPGDLAKPPQVDANGRQLNVSDALSYLDLVKSQFQDRPEVYNQFLEIMKEFKSHAIDTPGVIDRVSRLFYGCPSLIQGFNTFLPPGYRIECSDDPNEGVRVTTPSGTIMSDVNRRSSVVGPPAQAPPMAQSPPTAASHPAGVRGHSGQPYQQQQQYSSRRAPAPGTQAHMMQQSPTLAAHAPGVQAASSAIGAAGSASAVGQMTARSPSVAGSPTMAPAQRSQQVPMEFNHAINYVNKIKMRFAAEPDRYKDFLEILQTYQKESRPIQEVYAQVQVLFSGAPDLLDEFKQFLPDTSESAGSPSLSYARSMGGPALQGQGASGQLGMGGMPESMVGARLPPVGNFTPISTSGHGTDPFGPTTPTAASAAASLAAGAAGQAAGATSLSGRKRRGMMSGSGAQVPGSASSKRRSKTAKGEGMADAAGGYGQAGAMISAIQQPINPATATADELAFFERVKRFIGQPCAYNEFLKLLNLYNQQVLDPKTLVDRAERFIGDDSELFGWFKQFVGFDEQQLGLEDARSSDEAIFESILGPEPVAYMTPDEVAKTLRPPRPKVNLALCKEYGPSYRLLPDSSTQSRCSGRDAMCYEVLNDRWASHPTWASEDTEFVHHKKNQFEEAMFRSEEDRHEMDIEIDTNLS
ncbi:Transcriptional regulatory protein sin3, partial [Coemansia aciculifera]